MLYLWKKAEEPLGCAIVTAQELTIETFVELEKELAATGTFRLMDYAEGGGGEEHWKAAGCPTVDGSVVWGVEADHRGQFGWTNKQGRPMFTLSTTIDKAIEAFVQARLETYRLWPDKKEGLVVKDVTLRYKGPKAEYTGPCVCDTLLQATVEKPFQWEKATEGGNFPQRCFRCSCGRFWWLYNKDRGLWAPVRDWKVWQMLMEYNGEPQGPVTITQEGVCDPARLREQGWIPIG